MRITTSERTLRDLHNAIARSELDLQPGFQRGDVWSKPKQQRLVDSVLRGWYVPPIHVVVSRHSPTEEILDGKQRLVSLEAFRNGEFAIDGSTEPSSAFIHGLDGQRFIDLPTVLQEKFNNFVISTVVLSDFEADEPGELFYRLNQPANLTPPEQRNAFYGDVRFQVRDLVARMPELGLTEDLLGFGNRRMAYEDVIARAGYSLRARSIREKVTALQLADMYRRGEAFPSAVLDRLVAGMRILGNAGGFARMKLRFNKATVYSWLCFHSQISGGIGIEKKAAHFTAWFEELRRHEPSSDSQLSLFERGFFRHDSQNQLPWRLILSAFADRSSSRVADVSSVLLRDAVLWLAWHSSTFKQGERLHEPADPREISLGKLSEELRELRSTRAEDPDAVSAKILDWAEMANWGSLDL